MENIKSVVKMKKLFGTDGIRGIANTYPMTPEIALKVGRAAGLFFKNYSKKSRIVIGKDTRRSGYMIEYALTSGLCSAGADVLLVGPMPTPAVAHLVRSFSADAGIVVSASHNPAEHNGIKFFSRDGFKLADWEEHRIEEIALKGGVSSGVTGERIGRAFRIDDAAGRYIEFAKASANNISLKGLKIVLDCANGAAYKISPAILSELGADVVVLNNQPNGLNINQNCGALYPEGMIQRVREEAADVGIALDGDADRLIMCDENGELVDGDEVMAILALQLKREGRLKDDAIVATTMSNMGLEIAMREHGIRVLRTDVGDRYVVDMLRRKNLNFGGEQSGHIILMDASTTGDGTIAALQVLRTMRITGKKLSELKKCIIKLPQTLVNVEVREKKPLEKMPRLMRLIKSFEKVIKPDGRILVRYSGTENLMRIMVEGKSEAEIERIASSIAEAARREVGIKCKR